MPHDVFVSHASADKEAAAVVVSGLESAGVRCWVAPRDVPVGANYQGAIVRAVRDAGLLVLIYSARADASRHVLRELQLADDSGKAVLPLRIEDAPMGDDMAYYLGTPHWLDALSAPLAPHVDRLARAVQKRLGLQGPREVPPVSEPPPGASLVAQAETAFRLRQDTEAERLWRRAADMGNPEAQTRLGDLYYSRFAERDPFAYLEDPTAPERSAQLAIESVRWYEKAVAQGDVVAMCNVAAVYRDSDYCRYKRDDAVGGDEAAAAMYAEACNRGSMDGCFRLATMYLTGVRQWENPSEAERLLRVGAEQGHEPSRKQLTSLYLDGVFGVDPRPAMALPYLTATAEAGDVEAQWQLAHLYETGYGVSVDLEAAARWYEKAASRGDASAQYALGRLAEAGQGTSRDLEKARELFRLAAGQGHEKAVAACARLGG